MWSGSAAFDQQTAAPSLNADTIVDSEKANPPPRQFKFKYQFQLRNRSNRSCLARGLSFFGERKERRPRISLGPEREREDGFNFGQPAGISNCESVLLYKWAFYLKYFYIYARLRVERKWRSWICFYIIYVACGPTRCGSDHNLGLSCEFMEPVGSKPSDHI
jgi:hypothetical protein